MRKQIVTLLAGALLIVGTVTSASAIMYGSIDVGARDVLIGSSDLGNSGNATELAWVKTILGSSTDWEIKYDTFATNWHLTNEAGTFAMDLQGTPEYYMVKTGNVNGGGNDHFLFDNVASLDWAVLNLSDSFGNGYTIANVGKFSHVVEFNNSTTPVPEPGTLMLLGLGMFGLAVYGKRRMNKDA